MTAAITISGFSAVADGSAWTVDGAWGLVRNNDGTLSLLDSEGYPSNHSLSDADAAHIVRKAGLGEELMCRWDYYASASR